MKDYNKIKEENTHLFRRPSIYRENIHEMEDYNRITEESTYLFRYPNIF